MRSSLVLAALAVAFGSLVSAAELTKEQVKKVLEKNPDLVLDVLRQNKKEFFDIVMQASQDEQQRRQKEAAEKEKKDFDESFKNPFKPAITDKTRIRGAKDAKYTLVEYSDFQCPYCGRGFQTVEALRQKYGKDLRFIFKDKPLSEIHPAAMLAARYFEAVSLQSEDKAWAFHDKLFQNQGQYPPQAPVAQAEAFFKKTAQEIGADMKRLEKDVDSAPVQAKIDADTQEATSFKFEGTPGFLLNGVPLRGAYPVDKFDEIVQRLQVN